MKRHTLLLTIAGLLATLIGCNPVSTQLSGTTKVVSIRDDLAINLYFRNSPPLTVRLAGVVFPDEICDQSNCISREDAMAKVNEIHPLLDAQLTGKTIKYELNGRTNRLKSQATIYDADNDIALPLISNGYVMWCPGMGAPAGKSTMQEYGKAEQEAIAAKKGIWTKGAALSKPFFCKPVLSSNAR